MMNLALAQMQAGPDPEANLQRGLEWIRLAGKRGAAVICFPELSFLPFFSQAHSDRKHFNLAETVPGPTVQKVREAAIEAGIVVIVNLYEKTARGDFYNTAVIVDADGVLKGKYRMAHIAEGPAFNEKF